MAEYFAGRRDGGANPEERQDVPFCWFLLNGGTRACIKERGHDAGVHEGPGVKWCGKDCPEPHGWREKHQCEGPQDE